MLGNPGTCRLQEASDFEKQEALRKFNHAKEAYEVLSDGMSSSSTHNIINANFIWHAKPKTLQYLHIAQLMFQEVWST